MKLEPGFLVSVYDVVQNVRRPVTVDSKGVRTWDEIAFTLEPPLAEISLRGGQLPEYAVIWSSCQSKTNITISTSCKQRAFLSAPSLVPGVPFACLKDYFAESYLKSRIPVSRRTLLINMRACFYFLPKFLTFLSPFLSSGTSL